MTTTELRLEIEDLKLCRTMVELEPYHAETETDLSILDNEILARARQLEAQLLLTE